MAVPVQILSQAFQAICNNEVLLLEEILVSNNIDINLPLFDREIFDELYDDAEGPRFETLMEVITFILPESAAEMVQMLINRGANTDALNLFRIDDLFTMLAANEDPNVPADISAVFRAIVRARSQPFPQAFFNKVIQVASNANNGINVELNINLDEAIFLLLSKGQMLPESFITGQEQVLLYCMSLMGLVHML